MYHKILYQYQYQYVFVPEERSLAVSLLLEKRQCQSEIVQHHQGEKVAQLVPLRPWIVHTRAHSVKFLKLEKQEVEIILIYWNPVISYHYY